MLYLKRLEDILEADLQGLVTQGVREGQHIDYKGDINLTPPKAKPELLRDVSSFANAAGGDYVLGIEETDGLPTKVEGLKGKNIEELEQQILQTCRAHIDPPITGIRFHSINRPSGNVVLIVRIPKTWNSPHMVMMDNENRCWTRDNSGKRMMDIPDLKQALAFSEGAAERMRRFRMERIGNIISKETPIPLYSNQAIIFHLLPLVSFTGNLQVDLQNVADVGLPPMNHGSGWSPTFTLEGKMTYTQWGESPVHTYMLLFRNGIIEGVETSGLEPRKDGNLGGMKFFFTWHHGLLIDALTAALKVYRKLAIPTPIFGAVSLTGVRDYRMYIDPMYSGRGGLAINRDVLALPEFIIEDLNIDPVVALKPAFDVWWQACGYNGMPAWVGKNS